MIIACQKKILLDHNIKFKFKQLYAIHIYNNLQQSNILTNRNTLYIQLCLDWESQITPATKLRIYSHFKVKYETE